jgi:hypothetical protein
VKRRSKVTKEARLFKHSLRANQHPRTIGPLKKAGKRRIKMVEWLALFVSVVGLILNIITMREKLMEAFHDLRKRQKEKKRIKKEKNFIEKLLSLDKATRESYKPIFVIFTFFVSCVSSAMLGLTTDSTSAVSTLIIYGLTTFVVTFSVLMLLLLISINSFDFGSYLTLVLSSIGLGLSWVTVAVGLSLLTGYSVLFAGIFTSLSHLVSNYLLVTKLIR